MERCSCSVRVLVLCAHELTCDCLDFGSRGLDASEHGNLHSHHNLLKGKSEWLRVSFSGRAVAGGLEGLGVQCPTPTENQIISFSGNVY